MKNELEILQLLCFEMLQDKFIKNSYFARKIDIKSLR